jgi:hypothetical protein
MMPRNLPAKIILCRCRQGLLDKCIVFGRSSRDPWTLVKLQGWQPQELHTGRKGRQRTRAVIDSAWPKLFLMNERKRTAGLTGGNLAALPAAEDARHNEGNPKGRSKR